MTLLDLIIALPIGILVFLGWKRGVVREAATLAGVLIGIWTAVNFAQLIASLLGLTGESMTLCLYIFLVYAVAGSLRSCNWLHNDLFRAGGDPIFGTVLTFR